MNHMRLTAYFSNYIKTIIKEKTRLPLEKIILKKADFADGCILVEIDIDSDTDIPLYNEKYLLFQDLDDDSGYLYDYQKNKKIYEWG